MMPAFEAWMVLGRNVGDIITKVSQLPLQERSAALKAILDEARGDVKRLRMAYHPDRGGDPEKFKRIGEAIIAIEFHTEEFDRKLKLRIRQLEEAQENRVFIKVD